MVGEVMVRIFKSMNEMIQLTTSIDGNLKQHDEINLSKLTVSRLNKRGKDNFAISITPFHIIAGYYIGLNYTEFELNCIDQLTEHYVRFDRWTLLISRKADKTNEKVLHIVLQNLTEEEVGYNEEEYL